MTNHLNNMKVACYADKRVVQNHNGKIKLAQRASSKNVFVHISNNPAKHNLTHSLNVLILQKKINSKILRDFYQ